MTAASNGPRRRALLALSAAILTHAALPAAAGGLAGDLAGDDFEAVSPGAWPAPDWVAEEQALDGGANRVEAAPGGGGGQALRLRGVRGGTREARAVQAVALPARCFVECDVRFELPETALCTHGAAGGGGAGAPGVGLLDLLPDGTLLGAGAPLGTVDPGTWLHVRVLCEQRAARTVLTYWLDGVFAAQVEAPPLSQALDHVVLGAGDRVAWFDNLRVYGHEGRIALVNPDPVRVLARGRLEQGGTYRRLAHGTLPDGADPADPAAWTGTGAQEDFLAAALQEAGFHVETFSATDLPPHTPGLYDALVVQDPLLAFGEGSPKAGDTTPPDLLDHTTNAVFLARVQDTFDAGVPLVLVGDAVRLLEDGPGRLNMGKTVASYHLPREADAEDPSLPARSLFVRGGPASGTAREGAAAYRALGGPLAPPGAALLDVALRNGNDLPLALLWPDAFHVPSDAVPLLEAAVAGEGAYVLDDTVPVPPVYTNRVDADRVPLAGYTAVGGRRVLFLSSEAFFDFHFRGEEGLAALGDVQEIRATVGAGGREALSALLHAAIENAWTSPGDLDTDLDGLPDAWEREAVGSVALAGRFTDLDGDGLGDPYERLAGTDPLDAASCVAFHLPPERNGAGTGFVLRWHSISNRVYRVDRSTDLGGGFSTLTPAGLPATPPVNVYTDTNAPPAGACFYRVRMAP